MYFSVWKKPAKQYLAWAGATVISKRRMFSSIVLIFDHSESSILAHNIQWVDPAGMKVLETSDHWCDQTKHYGYESPLKHPSSDPRTCRKRNIDRMFETTIFI